MQHNEKIGAKQLLDTKTMVLVGLMASLLCVVCPCTIPIGPVPLSLSLLAVYLCVYVLGQLRGALTVLVYLCVGLTGLPVFSGFSGGPAKLFGPTGGYLIGYLPLALISGWFIQRTTAKQWPLHIVGMLLGLAVCYALGTLWFALSMHTSPADALTLCVYPFLAWDLLKIGTGCLVGNTLRRILAAGNLLPNA